MPNQDIEDLLKNIKNAAEQLRLECGNLLNHFKRQIMFEREQHATGTEEKRQKKEIAIREMNNEWALVKSLHSSLVDNIRNIVDINTDEKVKAIESILAKLAMSETPFVAHEFQFPFTVSVLLSGIQGAVKAVDNFANPSLQQQASNNLLSVNSIKLDKSSATSSYENLDSLASTSVKLAAKKFEEISEKVTESAIRSKRVPLQKQPTLYMAKLDKLKVVNAEDSSSSNQEISEFIGSGAFQIPTKKTWATPSKSFSSLKTLETSENSSPAKKMLMTAKTFRVDGNEKENAFSFRGTGIAIAKNEEQRDSVQSTNNSYISNGIVSIRVSDAPIENVAINTKPKAKPPPVKPKPEKLQSPQKKTFEEKSLQITTKSIQNEDLPTGQLIQKRTPVSDFEDENPLRSPEKRGSPEKDMHFYSPGVSFIPFDMEIGEYVNRVLEGDSVNHKTRKVEQNNDTIIEIGFDQYSGNSLNKNNQSSSNEQLNADNKSDQKSSNEQLQKKNAYTHTLSSSSNGKIHIRTRTDSRLEAKELGTAKLVPAPILTSNDSNNRDMIPKTIDDLMFSTDPSLKTETRDAKKLSPDNQGTQLLATDEAKRRTKIASVMLTDRDYIINIMDAFDDVEKQFSDLSVRESSSSSKDSTRRQIGGNAPFKNFGIDHEQLLGSTDKNVETKGLDQIVSDPPVQQAESKRTSKYDKPNQMVNNFPRPSKALPMPPQNETELPKPISTRVSKAMPSPPPDEVQNYDPPKPDISANNNFNRETEDLKDLPALPPKLITIAPGSSKDLLETPARTMAKQKITSELENVITRRPYVQLLILPLNAMFDSQSINMTSPVRFGRNNTTEHKSFLAFSTLVVSRNHADIIARDGDLFLKDIGSSSGTFRNNSRLSPANQASDEVEILSGDIIQLGKDFQDDSGLDKYGRIPFRKRCVKFQVILVSPMQTLAEALEHIYLPLETAHNRSSEIDNSPKPAPIQNDEVVIKPNHNGENASEPYIIPNPIETISNTNLNKAEESHSSSVPPPPKRKAVHDLFVLSYAVSGSGRVTKLQVNNAANGQIIIETNLKQWEDKGRITITDLRLIASRTFDILLATKPGAKNPTKLKSFSENVPWQISNCTGRMIGQIMIVSDIKLFITSTEKSEGEITVTGDLKNKKILFIKKSKTDENDQTRYGECLGKFQTKKNLIDTQWAINVEVEAGVTNRLLLCALILSTLLNP